MTDDDALIIVADPTEVTCVTELLRGLRTPAPYSLIVASAELNLDSKFPLSIISCLIYYVVTTFTL